MISVENLHKSFDRIKAVAGISFEIPKGEVFGILGPNGAGKTTTINMIVGILHPDEGTVRINGTADPTKPAIRRQIGNAPQSLALYEDLTAYENLCFFGRLYGLNKRQLKERVDYCLDFAQLTERRRDKVATFSGGMKRRLNMAVALIHDPPVLLFDEPTVGIDPQSRNMIFDCIEDLKKDGRTVVYTTHYMEEAQRLCDRVAIIDKGQILALGTVDELTEKYGGQAVLIADLDAIPENMDELPGYMEGDRLRVETTRPFEDLATLNRAGLKIRQLRVDKPDLEVVFLNLTGRRLRD